MLEDEYTTRIVQRPHRRAADETAEFSTQAPPRIANHLRTTVITPEVLAQVRRSAAAVYGTPTPLEPELQEAQAEVVSASAPVPPHVPRRRTWDRIRRNIAGQWRSR